MRNKKTFIGLALFVAVLVLGVGYAAVTNNLIISGTANATVSDANFVVEFDTTVEPTVTKSRETAEVTASITDTKTATIMIDGFTAKGDTATATYKIKNASPSDLSAQLSATPSSTNEDFKVEYSFEETEIAKDAFTTVTMTVTLEKTPIDQDINATVSLDITATAVQPQP